ncbi:MAG: hypothetical protein RIQ56_477 [Candidatus Parcubacteria bacterium]|jgi:putative transcriptional regulator
MSEKICNRVLELRTKAQMTQEDLAKRIGASRQTVIAIEKGNYSPSVLLALKIAECFKMPVERVFFIEV